MFDVSSVDYFFFRGKPLGPDGVRFYPKMSI